MSIKKFSEGNVFHIDFIEWGKTNLWKVYVN